MGKILYVTTTPLFLSLYQNKAIILLFVYNWEPIPKGMYSEVSNAANYQKCAWFMPPWPTTQGSLFLFSCLMPGSHSILMIIWRYFCFICSHNWISFVEISFLVDIRKLWIIYHNYLPPMQLNKYENSKLGAIPVAILSLCSYYILYLRSTSEIEDCV